ncbi:hypothetical protein K432DRAFT_297177 [Lepidopterella palustris CBS 459.81]|uniref:Peptidase C14 caspase domain-containing protein n=1 Tax=Lepidopterella palustris CBS 459.81 TaxID=1314670 RepID=A0A8E2EBA3_9PEZI|nr:hypothetical protein K432DRAFT_297177 [Lepidopterella palustris CBS 459.81]
MESNTSPNEVQYPLGDRVIHANIQSIKPEGPIDNGEATSSASQSKLSDEEKAALERASEMQLCWDESIARNMDLPDYYRNVAVLMIKWSDELDELKTRAEVEELEALFQNSFNYNTKVVELNVSKKPQHQLNTHLNVFVEEHDGPDNLMIVYYTGHGKYRDKEKYLELTATTDTKVKKGLNVAAQANWNMAEEALRAKTVDSDVLTILDTCFSSNIAKGVTEETRTYELLSACGLDSTTAAPGENSFTRALIDSLKELLRDHQSFTTSQLNQKILLQPARRDTPSILWNRLNNHDRKIRLAPLKPICQRNLKAFPIHPPNAYLTLRFALRDEYLNRQQIEYLTRHLAKVFTNKAMVGIRRIDWLGIRKPARTGHFGRAALAMFACAQWKKVTKRKRQERLLQQHPTPEPDSQFRPPSRKRTHDGMDVDSEDKPHPKREQLCISRDQPSQRMDPLTPPT